ncbi:MAG: type I DNA topoisomerase [Myxococcales bacterium]|nr:MAG: type I DNA topoisomerase [Myxococcales bacterium]
MAKSLVIVESPTKAKTISRFLGKDFKIIASVGHIKDLPKNALGVEVENHFEPKYEVIRGKGKILREIRKEAEKAEKVYLAPDPDREGEAIAWHIAEEIRKKNPNIFRILFHEITKSAIAEALEHPQPLDQNKFESQQARRILDRLVGYQLSPLLWEKVQRGLSAGRVQSVAVKLVVERERAIRAFKPVEYWSIAALYQGSMPPNFAARLFKIDGQKTEISNQGQSQAIVEELKSGAHVLSNIEKKERRRNPVPPFITSKLQQDASRRLRFSPKHTMLVAQQLYEGVEAGGEGAVGLITYMRTDSTRVSDQAIQAVREFISRRYGETFLPEKPNTYKNRKNSQDAHEAIRPTDVDRHPDQMKPFLSPDQYKLYRLIWERFVASQMAPAVFDATTFDIACGRYLMRATGQVMKFAGFTKVYTEGREEDEPEAAENGEGNGQAGAAPKSESDTLLPELVQGETLALLNLDAKQNFTQPPPRFSEAMLIKELEEQGIGRPSTYATILSTIQEKNYVQKNAGKLFSTELGGVVTDLLDQNFPAIMNTAFTAQMEERLDEVEEGQVHWLSLLQNFYGPFAETLTKAKESMRNLKREETPTGLNCPKCQHELVVKWGRNGSFIGCSAYPDCDFTSEFTRNEAGGIVLQADETTNETCEQCGGRMVIKRGRFGKFLACSNYPACRNTKPVKVGMKCPEPGCKGEVIEKRTKKGKLFFGCDQFPSCRFASWDKPRAVACPACNHAFMVERPKSDGGVTLRCPSCRHTMDDPKTAADGKNESAA